jgi:RNA-directed DNA polymerase
VSDRVRCANAQALTHAFVAGPWTQRAMVERAERALGRQAKWLAALAARTRRRFPADSPPTALWPAIEASIAADRGFRAGVGTPSDVAQAGERLHAYPRQYLAFEPEFAPGPVSAVLPLATERAVADWLGLSMPDLLWLADPSQQLARAKPGPLHHYHARWVRKRDGSPRLLEQPKPLLKSTQRKMLHDLLDRVPAHPAAHGFRRGRSILTFASPHAGQPVVIRVDLADFFLSVSAARVWATFATLGYSPPVCRLLTGLATTTTQPEILRRHPAPASEAAARRFRAAAQFLRARHLPQGAPTSPSLANLAAWRLDVRLSALAQALGATYGRYADDLAFSGGPSLSDSAQRVRSLIYRVIAEEGFAPNPHKSRVMRAGQRQELTGLVVNASPAVPRDVYDRLRATLRNCALHGPDSQNHQSLPDFRAHLEGRVAFVAATSTRRGDKLKQALTAIRW